MQRYSVQSNRRGLPPSNEDTLPHGRASQHLQQINITHKPSPHPKATHGSIPTEHKINKNPNTRQRTTRRSESRTEQCHHEPNICHCRRNWKDIHRPNGSISRPVKQRIQYMLVMYHYDTNAILVTPLKTRHGNEILRGYTKLDQQLTERGFKPTTHWLDNEASNALKACNRTHDVEYQLVPPHVHRRNSAERAIRTWKNHFVAGICSTNTAFPLHLWDRLIDQATITLNLLRPARRNPKMSAHQMLNGTFDYNRTPMAPPGTKIVVNEKNQPNDALGTHTASMVGTSAQPPNITAVTAYSSIKHDQKGSLTPLSFSHKIWKCLTQHRPR
jgi:hypothetical protein